MPTFLRSSPLLLALFSACLPLTLHAAPAAPTVPSPSPAVVVPAALTVPADQTLAFTLDARGVQIYVCQPTPGPKPGYVWTFKAPEADLFTADGTKVGRHYAGPTWEYTGDGKAVGRVKAKLDAPDGKGVPWLLLDVVRTSGGIMGKVRSIRRIDTAGGLPPSDPPTAADAGHERRVPYTAVYEFYAAK